MCRPSGLGADQDDVGQARLYGVVRYVGRSSIPKLSSYKGLKRFGSMRCFSSALSYMMRFARCFLQDLRHEIETFFEGLDASRQMVILIRDGIACKFVEFRSIAADTTKPSNLA